MANPIRGIKNRNVSPTATFPEQWITFHQQTLSPLSPAQIDPINTTASVWFMWKAPWDGRLVRAQAAIRYIAAGMTTCNVDVRNATGSMLSTTMDLKAKSQQVVEGVLASDVVFDKDEVLQIPVNCSNNETALGLSVSIAVRPEVGTETRT